MANGRQRDPMRRPRLTVSLALVLAGLAAIPVGATDLGEDGVAPAPPGVRWSALHFHAREWLGELEARVRVDGVPGAEVALAPAEDGTGIPPAGDRLLVLSVVTEIDPLLGSDVVLGDTVWLDPARFGALQQVRTKSGGGDYRKTYRFTPHGVYRLRRTPEGQGEAALDPQAWSEEKESYYAYPRDRPGCVAVLTPAALLYLASSLAQAPGGEGEACVFDRKVLYRVRIGAEDVSLSAKDVSALGDAGSADPGADPLRATAFTFDPVPLGDPEGEGFSFMGLSGAFRVLVEGQTGVPVLIEGRVAGLGAIRFRLQAVEFAQPPRPAAAHP